MRLIGLNRSRTRQFGVSLVETLVALGIMGVLMIPMLFFSSAFFTSKLATERQSMDVSHNAMQFLNRFMEEMYLTVRLLPSSTASTLYFAYYDPIQQQEVEKGYQLVTSGSNQYLQKLIYSASSGTWTSLSPYGTEPATSLLLPSSVVFTYCADSTCSTTTTPEKAIFVRLQNWSFSNLAGNQTLTLPTSVDVNLSAGLASGGVMLSENARLLSAFSTSTAFGSGSDPTLTFVNMQGNRLNNLNLGSAATSATAGGLSVILSGSKFPGQHSVAVANDGRVFFGEYTGVPATPPTFNGSFYTWQSGTGLSVLGSSLGSPGWNNIEVDPINSRVFFGDMNFTVRSWQVGGGLSVVLAGTQYPGWDSMTFDASSGKLFFGNEGAAGSTAAMDTWSAGNNLLLLTSAVASPGYAAGSGELLAAGNGSVYFSGPSNNFFYTWSASNGLSTINIPTTLNLPRSMYDATHNRVYIGDNSTNSGFWAWSASSGLSTIIAPGSRPAPGVNDYMSSTSDNLMNWADAFTPSGQIYFSESTADNPPPAIGASYNFYTWDPSTRVLSTILSNAHLPGDRGVKVDDTGRVFFGERSRNGSVDHFYTYLPTTGLSTLLSSVPTPGSEGIALQRSTGRVVFGGIDATTLYTWQQSTGLSVILTGVTGIGADALEVEPNAGRFYIGSRSSSGSFYTWQISTGLSVLASSLNGPGNAAMAVDPLTGGVYFGEGLNSAGKFYFWSPGQALVNINRVTPVGTLSDQSWVIENHYGPYTAVTQDPSNYLYAANSATKAIERYKYNVGTATFQRIASMGWSSWNSGVNALALDQSTQAISVLDTTNKKVSIYADRTVNGTPAAPTTLSLSGQATNPTGLAISGRTGNYLVADSTVQGSGTGRYITIYVYNSSLAYQESFNIVVTTASLPVDATGETNFKLLYDSVYNILYLVSPSQNYVFALSPPYYL